MDGGGSACQPEAMDATRLMPPKPRLIGTITPSGNTVVERMTQAMLRDLPEAAALGSSACGWRAWRWWPNGIWG